VKGKDSSIDSKFKSPEFPVRLTPLLFMMFMSVAWRASQSAGMLSALKAISTHTL
jgi:hypothetical protein